MKLLRNKKTGEIASYQEILTDEFIIDLFSKDFKYFYSKLCKIKDEWEDCKEPAEYYYIYGNDVIKATYNGIIEYQFKEIGNYFVTKEEAEKALKKHKALKRLKDKGFRFNSWTIPEEPKTPHIKLVIEAEMDVPHSPYDLELLFGCQNETL